MSQPEISVIIPTVDRGSERLRNLLGDLASLPDAEPSREVIVADYGGTFAHNMNRAAAQAKANTLLLLNDDLRLPDSMLFGLLWTAGRPLVGARLLYPNGLIQHAGIGFDVDYNPYNLWRLAPGEHPEAMRGRYLPAVTFAGVLIRDTLWHHLGGLDESYQNGYEDIDFCLRAMERGIRAWYEPTACAIHLEGQTPGRHDHDAASWQHFREKWVDSGRISYALGVWPFSVQTGGQG